MRTTLPKHPLEVFRSKTTPNTAALEDDDIPQFLENSKPPKKKARMTNQTKRGKGRGKARK